MAETATSGEIWPLIVYALAITGLIGLMLGLSHLLGQRRSDPATHEPYESGIVSQGSARLRFAVNYYVVAILFIIFDLEAVFLFAWAVAFREAGLAGFVEATVFVGILLVGLIYLWRLGALDWGGRQLSLKNSRSHRPP
ncbi:NAD(P)H-quinone oxidoreductase subunit 3 [Microbulbifer aggregans]|uniref:NADH-quinone oxidoreductase subunit A n=1 Tax=Microbulbifer aggregans TaxID=1769779 RepID=A0A1C9W856_9GAMM|nr:NADH-quinone oxidoreductase subunit A [Microbulbifer aggregans]AOS97310.1 NAD(P)H-quinone oxidoreductase subunit 3 [Microbulbifer aggregans]